MSRQGKRISRREFGRNVAVASGVVILGGVTPRAARAQSLRKVTFLFDVTAYGKHGLFYPAIEKGYFKDAGLDVTFQSGKGSADVAAKLAAGAAEFGFADISTTIQARGRGAALKQIMMIHYKNMNCCLTLADKPVRVPKDLEGKKIGATVGDAPRIALPAFAKINGFDHTKVEIVTLESQAKPAMLMSRQVDGVFSLTAFKPIVAAAAKRQGQEVVQLSFADHGMDVYMNGIAVRDETVKADPGLVRAFVEAMTRSVVFAVENPAEANAMFMKHNPAANPQIARLQLDIAIEHLMVPEVRANGIGPMSEKKMAFTVELVRELYGLQQPVAVQDVYTNEFSAAARKPKV